MASTNISINLSRIIHRGFQDVAYANNSGAQRYGNSNFGSRLYREVEVSPEIWEWFRSLDGFSRDFNQMSKRPPKTFEDYL